MRKLVTVTSKKVMIRCAVLGATIIALAIGGVIDSATAGTAPRPISVSVNHDGSASDRIGLESLEANLRETRAIGFLTKLDLKQDLDALLDDFDQFHGGRGDVGLLALYRRYEGLVARTLHLLRDDDPLLFAMLANSRGAIWQTLSDPVKFEALAASPETNRLDTRNRN